MTNISGLDPSSCHGPVDVSLKFITPPADGTTSSVDTTVVPDVINAEENHTVQLIDIRGHEREYDLDKNAFQAIQNVSSATTYKTFDSDAEIRRMYYPEVEDLLVNSLPGVDRVVILGYGVRRQNQDGHRQPIPFVHVDHTLHAAEDFVRQHTENENLPDALRGRYRIVSVWRSLNGTVQSMPLAFVSGDSLNVDDLFPVELKYSDHSAWFTGIKHNSLQQWHYWSGMENDERLLLKCTDTGPEKDKRAGHSAFLDPRVSSQCKPRESIEVRALVFG